MKHLSSYRIDTFTITCRCGRIFNDVNIWGVRDDGNYIVPDFIYDLPFKIVHEERKLLACNECFESAEKLSTDLVPEVLKKQTKVSAISLDDIEL